MQEKKTLLLKVRVSYGSGATDRLAILSQITSRSVVLLTDHEKLVCSKQNHVMSKLHSTRGISDFTILDPKFWNYISSAPIIDHKLSHLILQKGSIVDKVRELGYELYRAV